MTVGSGDGDSYSLQSFHGSQKHYQPSSRPPLLPWLIVLQFLTALNETDALISKQIRN